MNQSTSPNMDGGKFERPNAYEYRRRVNRNPYWRTFALTFVAILLIGLRYFMPATFNRSIASFIDGEFQTSQDTAKPNFIFIMTDDQDLHMRSVEYQPKVQDYFAKQGTFFSKHYCTISLCCPSRVSLLTGKAAHNTNITDVSLPYGGYTKFANDGWNENYLPVWLQQAGYNTYYTGKLMNGHSIYTYNKPYPKGWNGTDYLIDPGTYSYFNSTTQRNQDAPKQNPDVYSTDLIASNAVGFLEEALAADGPFFLGVAPIAPHSETILEESGPSFYAPVPAPRHKHLFPGLQVPRTPNFNPEMASGGGYVRTLAKQNETVVQYNDDYYRRRVQSLQSVDDLIESIMSLLEANPDVLENTYIIYTTDNGYHIGQHRLPPGKTCNIEEDINIPLYIRGPGIEKGKTASYSTTHTDLVPTIFQLAGIPLHDDFDGEPIPVRTDTQDRVQRSSEHVNIEFWSPALFEGIYLPHNTDTDTVEFYGPNNTYKSVRIISHDFDISYTVWCTNEHELYDMRTDPYQMNNQYPGRKGQQMFGYDIEKLVSRVDALLLTLKACKAKQCTRPWSTLHPNGKVKSLGEAMDAKYDDFYQRQQRKVQFAECADGFLPWLEQPLHPLPYVGDSGRLRRPARWEDWT